MPRSLSFTEKRRARLRKAVDRIERLETRNTITEPISVTGLSVSALRGLAQLGVVQVHGGGDALEALQEASQAARQRGNKTAGAAILPLAEASDFVPIVVGSQTSQATAGGSAHTPEAAAASAPGTNDGNSSVHWLSLSPAASDSDELGILTPLHPAKPAAGGTAQAPPGGSGALSAPAHGAITPLRVPPPAPAPSSAAGGSAALLAAAAGSASPAPASPAGSAPQPAPAGPAKAIVPPRISLKSFDGGPPGSSGGSPPGSTVYSVTGNSSGASQNTFAYFPVYVLDWNDGSVMMPGADQYATFGKYVDLRAQVIGTTVSSISWDTSQLSPINFSSATNTYRLTFAWSGSHPAAAQEPLTLTVTDINSHTETFTYEFWVPQGSGTAMCCGSTASWPSSLPPDQVLAQAPALDSHNVSVDATSGSLNTTLNLPSYNATVPAVALTYNSMAADPRPIVMLPHTLDPTKSVPSQVSGQITVKDTSGNTKYTGTTWYYNTSQFMAGDTQQIALQADMTGQSTGRYNYTVTVVDYRTTNTTTTITGTETVLNQSSSTFGDGWTLDGLEQITPASGGVILSLGEGGKNLWFSGNPGSGGGTYTDPKGEFSTLAKNANGTYTRTLNAGLGGRP